MCSRITSRTSSRVWCGTFRGQSSLRADSAVWLSHTSSVWPWSGAPKARLYSTFIGGLRHGFPRNKKNGKIQLPLTYNSIHSTTPIITHNYNLLRHDRKSQRKKGIKDIFFWHHPPEMQHIGFPRNKKIGKVQLPLTYDTIHSTPPIITHNYNLLCHGRKLQSKKRAPPPQPPPSGETTRRA